MLDVTVLLQLLAGNKPVDINQYWWRKRCSTLFELRVAA